MKAFEFASPASVADVVKALGGAKDATILAGGTDLINRMKDLIDSPSRVINIKDVKDLAGVEGDANAGLTIGANTRLVDLIGNKVVQSAYPALAEAALQVGTPQIRNMATVGGNLLQRPRCWFFRSGFGILGMKDGKSLVRSGDNRYHSVFMTEGDALFVNPSNLATALTALGAKATVLGPNGERTVSIPELYAIPKTNTDRETTVGQGEILTKVTLPGKPGKNATYCVRGRGGEDWPLVMASVNLQGDKAGVTLYGVAPVPFRAVAAEKAIAGKEITMETASAAAEAAVEGAKPLSMNTYKVALIKTAVKRALLTVAGQRYWVEG